MIRIDKQKDIDILFIAEGTYPFVRGGVSTWIDQIIRGIPEFNFGILFLGSKEDHYEGIQYKVPDNVVYLEDYYIFSAQDKNFKKKYLGPPEIFELINFIKDPHEFNLKSIIIEPDFYKKVTYADFLYSFNSWLMLEHIYITFNVNVPFVDFFWTMINIFNPLWTIVKAIYNVQDRNIKIIHSPSTGYAGFLGAMLKQVKNIPYIITEHGIYTKERKIDILNAKWAELSKSIGQSKYHIDDLKMLWINFFVNLGKITYLAADRIFSLFHNAREFQISLGAPKEKTDVIPNGVDLTKYEYIINRRNYDQIPKAVALIGRVVPIKDIKTFIKAIKLTKQRIEDVKGWIVGPEEEDREYVEECKILTKTLGLENAIKFMGFQDVSKVLPMVGLTTLTSISEGMPLIILESFAAGIPCVATDVGACRQLIYGGFDEKDLSLGKAGEVVEVGDVSSLAKSYTELLLDSNRWKQYRETAITRVKNYYSLDKITHKYKIVYEKYMGN
ncbi:GT4 family glycosyltransferase PelF [Desulfothermus okinawensis JCM 13304]